MIYTLPDRRCWMRIAYVILEHCLIVGTVTVWSQCSILSSGAKTTLESVPFCYLPVKGNIWVIISIVWSISSQNTPQQIRDMLGHVLEPESYRRMGRWKICGKTRVHALTWNTRIAGITSGEYNGFMFICIWSDRGTMFYSCYP